MVVGYHHLRKHPYGDVSQPIWALATLEDPWRPIGSVGISPDASPEAARKPKMAWDLGKGKRGGIWSGEWLLTLR